jgi:hypothetical protein
VLGAPRLKTEAGNLKTTMVSPTLDVASSAGTSVLWCATFQLAWNQLKDELGEPLTVSGSPEALAMSRQISACTWKEQDLDSNSYVALAGTGSSDVLNRIREELTAKFKGAASPSLLPSEVADDQILAYAYLFKHLEFAIPFERISTPVQFNSTPVQAFGLTSSFTGEQKQKIASQVKVFDYQDSSHWAIELETKAEGDRLLIVRSERLSTLAQTVEHAMKMFRGEPAPMGSQDTLAIPVMNFDVTRRFFELQGASISGSRHAGVLEQAMQNIRFKLDEKGAVLKSEVVFGVTSAPRSRRFVCDGPFLVIMMRKDAAQPYFVASLESPELLVPFEKD